MRATSDHQLDGARTADSWSTLDDDQLFAFCQLNRDLRIEREAEGVLVLTAPAGGQSSARNLELCCPLANWARRDGRGIAFDSSVGFTLPNGAMRSPDAAWVRRERWDALIADQREKFPPPPRCASPPPFYRRHHQALGHRLGNAWAAESGWSTGIAHQGQDDDAFEAPASTSR